MLSTPKKVALKHLITSDEAHFDRYVNKQNCTYWGRKGFEIMHEKPLHSEKITV